MKRIRFWVALSALAFCLAGPFPLVAQGSPTVPTAKAEATLESTSGESATAVSTTTPAAQVYFSTTRLSPTQELHFGTTVEDPYRWLEDSDSEKVQAWDRDEDRTTREFLSHLRARPALKRRLKQLMVQDDVSLPQEANGTIIFSRRPAFKDQPTLYWHAVGGEDIDHVLLKPRANPSEVLERWFIAPDSKKLAYEIKNRTSGETVLHVRTIETWHEDPADDIAGVDGTALTWTPDSKRFYYVRLPVGTTIPPSDRLGMAQIFLHTLGAPSETDPMIFPETHNSNQTLSPYLSSDGLWLFILISNGAQSTNIFFREVQNSSSTFKPLFVSTAAAANVCEWGGALYILTTEGAPHAQIEKTFVRQADPSSWSVLVPERADTRIVSMHLVSGFLVLTILRDNKMGLEVRRLDGSLQKTVLEPTLGEIREASGSEYSDSIYFDFDSVVTPRQIYRLAVQSGSISTWWKPEHSIDPASYEGIQLHYSSKDGTPIPMFIIKRKGLPLDGSVPFLLDGGAAVQSYNAMLIPWLEAGGGFAVPSIRHDEMAAEPQQPIEDFIAAADYLIANHYTRPEHLAIQGAFTGALVIGAAMTQRPELFRAVVAKAPLFDMIRYPLFGQGSSWISEFGSPEAEDQFQTLYAYSPYHHVKPGAAYPSTLILAPEDGAAVDPMHARKMTASLQAATTSFHPILFETDPTLSANPTVSQAFLMGEFLDRLSFLFNAVKMKPTH